MANRTETLVLHLMATTYHRRPSEIVGIADAWAAYQFDAAVLLAGLERRQAHDRRRPRGALSHDPALINGDWSALAQM